MADVTSMARSSGKSSILATYYSVKPTIIVLGTATALGALWRRHARAVAKMESKSLSVQLSKQVFEQNARPEFAISCLIAHFLPCLYAKHQAHTSFLNWCFITHAKGSIATWTVSPTGMNRVAKTERPLSSVCRISYRDPEKGISALFMTSSIFC